MGLESGEGCNLRGAAVQRSEMRPLLQVIL